MVIPTGANKDHAMTIGKLVWSFIASQYVGHHDIWVEIILKINK